MANLSKLKICMNKATIGLAEIAYIVRQKLVSLSSHFLYGGYLRKWLFLGVLIGVGGGLGAVVFADLLSISTHFFLGIVVGYHVPTSAASGDHHGSAKYLRPWALPLITTSGALLAGIIISTLAPKVKDHGIDGVLLAAHKNPWGMRFRAVIGEILAAAATIGSGGSAGPEGPTAQITGGTASMLARTLYLSPGDARIAVASGIGSGIGAIFRAPLGGAIFSAEILYRQDLEAEVLIPSAIASAVAYGVFGSINGFRLLFAYKGKPYVFNHPLNLLWYLLLGVVAGGMGILYAKGFYGISDWFARRKIPFLLKVSMGGAVTGVVALAVPEVLGTGNGWVQRSLQAGMVSIPLWIILAVPFLHILTTSASLGSGGIGGTFGPGIVIGAFTGAAFWRLFHGVVPGIPHSAVPFVIVSMMACFGSASRAPFAVLVMVAEMTGTIGIMPPAMIAVGVATAMAWQADVTIYRSQPDKRRQVL